MATATLAWYGPGLKRVVDGEIDFNAHTFKGILCATAYTPNPDTDDDLSDIVSHERTGTNWAAGGQTVTISSTDIDTTNNRVRIFMTDISVATVTLTDGKTFVVYDDTHASDALVAYGTFDTALAPTAGTLLIDFDATLGALRLTY